jgi:hypothetical protein
MASIDTIPLDCLRLIAMVDLATYRAMLAVKRFAMLTLGDNNVIYQRHFTVKNYGHCNSLRYVEYKLNGKRHRDDDLPAVIFDHDDELLLISDTQEWYQFDKLHRENDLPAIVYSDGCKSWYWRGELHRDDGPAYIGKYSRQWYRHDIPYRSDDKPTCEYTDGRMHWRNEKNRLHRSGGLPAVVYPDGTSERWIRGKRIMNPYCMKLRDSTVDPDRKKYKCV